jgi:hypothetical protein
MQLDVSISISRQTAVNSPYNVQLVSVERYVMNISLRVIGNFHGQQRQLSTQSAKLNIMMLSAVGFSEMNFLISIPMSG